MRKSVVLLVLFGLLSIPFSLSAQTGGYSTMGLYTDASGNTSVTFVDQYEQFTVYLFVQPGDNGMTCTEFALEHDPGLTISGYQANPDVALELGSFETGLSSCMDDCREDWTLMHTITFLSMTSEQAGIRIVRHPDAGYHQVANCLFDRDIEPAFVYPDVCINQVCMPDEEPPSVTDVAILSETEIQLRMSERIFLPDAVNRLNYLIYKQSDSSEILPVLDAGLRGDDDHIWIRFGSPLDSEACELRLSGLRDMAGNAIPSGTTVVFNETDMIPPWIQSARAADDSTVVVVFNEQVAPASASDSGNYSVVSLLTGETVPVDSAQLQADGVTAVLRLSRPMERGVVHEVTAGGIQDLSGNILAAGSKSFMSIDDVPPLLSGVFVDAESYLRIVYNEAMDPVSSASIGNYAIFRAGDPVSGSTIEAATASNDSSVILHLAEGLESETLYSLAVNGAMDSSLNMIVPDTFEFSYPDTIPPLFRSAVSVGGMTVELGFSEELDADAATNAAAYRLYADNTPSVLLPVDSIELMSGASLVRLHLGVEMVLNGRYTVFTNSLADRHGNIMQAEQGRHFTHIERVPPVVTGVAVKSPGLLRVEFNEPLYNATVGDLANYVIFEEGDTAARMNVVSADQSYAAGTITLGVYPSFSDNIFYELCVSGISDLARNGIDPDTSYVFYGRDAVQPELEDYLVENENAVILTFDEAMDPQSLVDPDLYSFYRSGDPSAVLATGTVTIQGDRSVRVETAEMPVPQEMYTLHIVNVMDAALNVIVPITIDISFSDDIPPVLTGAEPLSVQTVRLEFSEVLHPESAADAGNYRVCLAGSASMAVPVITAERSEDGSIVILRLGGSLEPGRTYRVDVIGIFDMYGNVISITQMAEFLMEDDELPYVTDVSVVHMLEILVTFNEALATVGAEDAASYTLFIAGDTANALDVEEARIRGDLRAVSLKPMQLMIPGTAYLLRVSGVSDLSGNQTDPDTLYEFLAADDAPPELAGLVTSGDSVVTLTFSEPLEPASVAGLGNITITDSRDHLVTLAIDSIGQAGEGKVVTLVLVDHAVVGLPYILGIAGIMDLAGNPIVTVQEEFSFIGGTDDPPRAVFAEATGNNDVIVHFDKQLERASAEIDSNYYLYQAVDPMTRRRVDDSRLLADGSSVQLTLEKGLLDNIYFTIVISDVRDIYGNSIEPGSETGLLYVDQYLRNSRRPTIVRTGR